MRYKAIFIISVSFLAAQALAGDFRQINKSDVNAALHKNCRNISAEIRSGAPLTREIVIAELVRARAEGEMDFYISAIPPAVNRPLCELPSEIKSLKED